MKCEGKALYLNGNLMFVFAYPPNSPPPAVDPVALLQQMIPGGIAAKDVAVTVVDPEEDPTRFRSADEVDA